eukprot:15357125-Ditylum_brightwellii.AAC.1
MLKDPAVQNKNRGHSHKAQTFRSNLALSGPCFDTQHRVRMVLKFFVIALASIVSASAEPNDCTQFTDSTSCTISECQWSTLNGCGPLPPRPPTNMPSPLGPTSSPANAKPSSCDQHTNEISCRIDICSWSPLHGCKAAPSRSPTVVAPTLSPSLIAEPNSCSPFADEISCIVNECRWSTVRGCRPLPPLDPSGGLGKLVNTLQPTSTASVTSTVVKKKENTAIPAPTSSPALITETVNTLQPTSTPSATPTVVNPKKKKQKDDNKKKYTDILAPTSSPPTKKPSIVPSLYPSAEPAMNPSVVPSVNPSVVPSLISSVVPSLISSVAPTKNPSMASSVNPPIASLIAEPNSCSLFTDVTSCEANHCQWSTLGGCKALLDPLCGLGESVHTLQPTSTPSIAPTVFDPKRKKQKDNNKKNRKDMDPSSSPSLITELNSCSPFTDVTSCEANQCQWSTLCGCRPPLDPLGGSGVSINTLQPTSTPSAVPTVVDLKKKKQKDKQL